MLLVLLAAVVCISDPALAQQQTPRTATLSTAQIATRNSPALVTIVTPSAQGSGVIIDPSGVIVTNLHVVRGDQKASVRLANGDAFDDVRVIDVDEGKDILLLKIRAVELPAAVVGNSEQVRVGQKVVVIGSPRGLDRTVSDGVISAVRDTGEGYRLLQTTAAISPGSSGGGMFNERGELIGITSAKVTDGENINFAIPVNYVRGMLSGRVTGDRNTGSLEELAKRFPASAPTRPETAAASQTGEAGDKSGRIRLLALLEASGLRYEKTGDQSWSVSFKGEHKDTVTVHVALLDEFAVFQATVMANAQLNANQLTQLMRSNFSENLVKSSLDGDGDLRVLNETEMRLLDGTALKTIINAVARFTDDLAGSLVRVESRSPSLSVSTETASDLGTPRIGGNEASLTVLRRTTLRYDRRDWTTEAVESGITQFTHRSGEVWARVIAERVEIPITRMEDVALGNAREADPNARVIRRGTRTVNGMKMMFLEIDATVEHVPVRYYGHYYSDSSGTVQIIGWTSRNLIEEHRPLIENFVSGFQER
jgi:hypothetical protein